MKGTGEKRGEVLDYSQISGLETGETGLEVEKGIILWNMEVEIVSWPLHDQVSSTGEKFGLEYIFWSHQHIDNN